MKREGPAPERPGPVLGRRGLLRAGAGTAALAALTGCSLNNPFSSAATPAASAVPDLAPDVALAVTAVGLLLDAQDRAQQAVRVHPGLRSGFAGMIALHAAHLEALRSAVPGGVDPSPVTATSPVPRSRGVAIREQRALEQALHDRLTGLALRAESGPFARLLGSMAAAVSQQLVVLGRSGAQQ